MGKILLFSVLLYAAVVAAMGVPLSNNGKPVTRKRHAFQQQSRQQQGRGLAMAPQPPYYDDVKMTSMEPFEMQDETELWEMDNSEEFAEEEAKRGGVAYIRWGRTVCPEEAELVYAGRAAGPHYTQKGGGSNYQCITLKPENFDFGPGTVDAGLIYGSEYEVWGNVPKAFLKLHEHDVPCAVCYVSKRTAKITIPGTYKCPKNWKTEYYGYLMTEHHAHYRSTFECIDKEPETAISGHQNLNGDLFYFVEPRCGTLPCPPYDQQKEMTCAVCTR